MSSPTFVRTVSATLAALLLLATCARAAPSLRYSWDSCDPLVLNRDFTVPGHYAQTLSVTGLGQSLTSFNVHIVIAPRGLSAWQFNSFGCQGASRLAASTVADGCLSIPGLELTVFLFLGVTEPKLSLLITGLAPAGFVPDPAARYTLVRLDFDHSATTTGLVDPPGQCGGGDVPVCFGIESADLNGHPTPGVDYTVENGFLTWNIASTPGQCPFRVAARPSTWGRLKSIYR
jgi:hypothetical protein